MNLAHRLEKHGYSSVAALALLAIAAVVLPTDLGAHGGSNPVRALFAGVVACVAVSIVPFAASLAPARPDFRLTAAATASAGAAAIHFAVISEHLDEYWLFGLFFFVSGAAQLAWAIIVVLRPLRVLVLLGLLGNAAIIVLWIVSRTGGLPLGPDAGSPEPIAIVDVVASILEGLVVASSAWYLGRPANRPGGQGLQARAASAVPILIAALVALALVASGPHGHSH
jgi:hypothetical protein